MAETVWIALYIALGVVWLSMALPKYRDVLVLSRQPADMFDQILFGIVSFLTVIFWPVVALGWAFAVLGRMLAR